MKTPDHCKETQIGEMRARDNHARNNSMGRETARLTEEEVGRQHAKMDRTADNRREWRELVAGSLMAPLTVNQTTC